MPRSRYKKKKKKKGKNREKQGKDGCCHRRIDNIVKKSRNTSECHSSVFSYIDHIFKDFSKNMNVCVVRSTCIGEENMLFNMQPSAAVVQGLLNKMYWATLSLDVRIGHLPLKIKEDSISRYDILHLLTRTEIWTSWRKLANKILIYS